MLAGENAFAAPANSVPLVTFVLPVYVKVPETVGVPPPWTVSVPDPSTGVAKVKLSGRLITSEPPLWTGPVTLPAPAVVPLPICSVAFVPTVTGPVPVAEALPMDPTSRATILPLSLIVVPP